MKPILCAVVGNGPRTGTTFVMDRLHQAGLPVSWDRTLKIPGAGYDMLPNMMFHVKHGIVKAWPPILPQLDLERVVVLRRDYAAQVRSTYRQKKREEKAGIVVDSVDMSVERVLEIHDQFLEEWLLNNLTSKVLEVRTEELDQRIDEIVDWMRVPYVRRAA